MDKILEALKAAVEKGALTQETFDQLSTSAEGYVSKSEIEKNYVSKEDVNTQIQERLKRNNEKFEPQLAELETLKTKLAEFEQLEEKATRLQNELETATGRLNEIEATEKETKFKAVVEAKVKELLGDRELTGPYKELIFNKVTNKEDETEIVSAVTEVATQFKTDFPVYFGGGSNPNGAQVDYSEMSTNELFSLGLQMNKGGN